MQTATSHGMPTERMTFSVPAKLKRRLQKRKDVNWSAIVARALGEHLSRLEILDRVDAIVANSKLTQADVDELAETIDTAIARKLGLR